MKEDSTTTKETKQPYSKIPDSIIFSHLTKTEIQIYSIISSFERAGKSAFCSNQYFADKCGVTKRAVMMALTQLVRCEVIKEHREGKVRSWVVLDSEPVRDKKATRESVKRVKKFSSLPSGVKKISPKGEKIFIDIKTSYKKPISKSIPSNLKSIEEGLDGFQNEVNEKEKGDSELDMPVSFSFRSQDEILQAADADDMARMRDGNGVENKTKQEQPANTQVEMTVEELDLWEKIKLLDTIEQTYRRWLHIHGVLAVNTVYRDVMADPDVKHPGQVIGYRLREEWDGPNRKTSSQKPQPQQPQRQRRQPQAELSNQVPGVEETARRYL